MSKRLGRHGLLAVLLIALLTVLFTGCNEGTDFDPDALFSIEDYATDQDYALTLVGLMNQWHETMGKAKGFLDTNVDGLTFTESIPAGWVQVDPTSRAYPWSVQVVADPNSESGFRPATDDEQYIDDSWYVKSFQDSEYEFIRVDETVPGDNSLEPARIEFMQLEFLSNVYGGQFGVGDSVMVEYANGFNNPSELDGAAQYWGNRLVTAQDAPTDIAAYATMTNVWGGTVDNLSPDLTNPQGEFEINGITVLVRADLLETATLNVTADVSLRSNARGEATVRVGGVERARIVFEYFDTNFHGYYTLRESGFNETIRF